MYVRAQLLSPVQVFTTPRTVAGKAPLSMELSRQEYWNELPFPTLLTQGSHLHVLPLLCW